MEWLGKVLADRRVVAAVAALCGALVAAAADAAPPVLGGLLRLFGLS